MTTAGMQYSQQYSPHSPHSPQRGAQQQYGQHSPRASSHFGGQQQQTQQRQPPSPQRRHTSSGSPSTSPRRTTFFPPPAERELPPSRTASPAQGRGVGPRARARTEPSGYDVAAAVASAPSAHFNSISHAAGDRDRAHQQREQQQREQRALGHARKSSAYAALAALSGAHPSSSGARTAAAAIGSGSGNGTPGSTPPLSADVRDDYAGGASTSESEDERASYEGSRERERRGTNGRLLTPPATPPRHSLVVVVDGAVQEGESSPREGIVGLETLPHGVDGDGRPAFNARKASAQCRQLEGYVSFAAVEGLGEPPSPGPGGELDGEDDDDASKRKRGSLGAGIAGLWRGTFW
ncbi:hypothetical protein B0H16DRAFT_1455646 [Mycena metata]|uniref:Uncharacterized protein n=1 Tax=Mycena metata TaxID=1033252 RepID=A0AAD7NJ55_9AGAR|nr:hypothetical protein B0H16DRAFT_1455646 [Mycena metata]